MNLLGMLSGLLGDSNVTELLSGNTRLSGDTISKLLKAALPLLLKKLTGNASTEEGARSLVNALGQHATDAPLVDQIKDADPEDGAKIIGHILGDSAQTDISALAEQVGISSEQASGVLSNIAPSLLSNLSSVFTNGLPEGDGAEPAAEKEEGGSGIMGFIGKLFGKGDGEEDSSGFDGTNLLSALSALKPQQ